MDGRSWERSRDIEDDWSILGIEIGGSAWGGSCGGREMNFTCILKVDLQSLVVRYEGWKCQS